LPKPISHPKIRSTATDQQTTLAELGLERPSRIAAFCPGAEYGPAKRWPAAHFRRLAKSLAARGYAIWLFGSPKDHAVADEISQLAPGLCRNLCGATSLAQAIDLLAMAELVVCNDSGLMHVAAALDRPLVARSTARRRPASRHRFQTRPTFSASSSTAAPASSANARSATSTASTNCRQNMVLQASLKRIDA
jgi:lipopolysaccharide heptosyltransferase II